MTLPWRRVIGASVVLAAAGLSACGGDSQAGQREEEPPADVTVNEAEQVLESAASGIVGSLPDEKVRPPDDKSVWVISCGQVGKGCAAGANAVVEAGSKLGWEMKLFDGQFDPARWNTGIRQAAAAGADAVVLGIIDCAPVKSSLKAAKRKGLLVTSYYGPDCDDQTQGGGEKLFDHATALGPNGEGLEESAEQIGAIQAAYLITHTDGAPKIVQFTNGEQAISKYIARGFAQQIERCENCDIVSSQPFLLADLGSTLTSKARSALLQHPDANAIHSPYDAASKVIAPAVMSLNRQDELVVTGANGDPENVELIRSDRGQTMSVGVDVSWLGWAATDDLARLFAGQEPVYSGFSYGLVDGDSLPDGGSYSAPVDFQSNYLKLWGLK